MASRPKLLPIALALAAGTTLARAEIMISQAQTQNMTCSTGVCSPTATDAVLNATDLENLLAAGNVEVTTTGLGVEAKDIEVATAIAWSGSTTLALQAHRSIAIGAAIAVGGPGGMMLASGGGGDISYSGGNITFADLASRLVINRKKFKLVDNIVELAKYFASYPGGYAAFADNYDASRDGTYTSSPVPSVDGIFDGLGNTISNLSVDNTSNDYEAGLFSAIDTGGAARNIVMANADVSSSEPSTSTGLLAGSVSGTISGCWTSGTVAGKGSVGGLTGNSTGAIRSSSSSATVSGTEAGGLVGVNSGTIRSSAATGAVGEVDDAGGLAGTNASAAFIEDSHATGPIAVSATDGVDGGLVGSNDGWLFNTYATGSVTAAQVGEGGGLVGEDSVGARITGSFANGSVTGQTATIGAFVGAELGATVNSYATGEVSGSESTIGGFVGCAGYCEKTTGGKIRHSYSTGAVHRFHAEFAGGFAGVDASSGGIGDAFWDITTSGERKGTGNRGNEPGLRGETSARLQARLPKGFSKGVWAEDPGINNGFPYLIHNPPPT